MSPLAFLSGKKTYSIGAALILYVLIQYINGEAPDENIVMALLAGQGISLRAGVKKSEAVAKGLSTTKHTEQG